MTQVLQQREKMTGKRVAVILTALNVDAQWSNAVLDNRIPSI
jgi:hypothetical protein